MRGFALVLVAAFALAGAPAHAQDPTATPEEIRGMDLLVNNDPSDDAEARRLLEIASEQDRPEAINALPNMVGNGLGGPEDDERAFALMQRAGELGSIGANLTLAEIYTRGAGDIAPDPALGLRHAIAAAEATSNSRSAAWAQWRLGMRYLDGENTAADPVRAYEWISRSSENGGVQGMLSRAVMLARGEGVAQDAAAARVWYQRAAESDSIGSAHALRGLGAMLIIGEGGPVDIPRGYAYLLLAEEGGDEMAPRLLQRFDSVVDARAREHATSIMAAWRINHGNPRPDRDPATGQLN
ncbi:MAG: tetratricopeptide repeat protein [Terricaulis sp.]